LCNTPGVADAYRAYGNQAHAFRPAVDRSLFHPRPDRTDDVVRIVFYGRPRNERNGFALGVEALRVVKERYGDDVDIVSVGAEFDTADFGADGVLTNLGILPNIEAVAELYGRSDIGLVFMFTKHPSYQPLEYMASGCATVTNYNEANLWLLRDRENASLAAPTVSSVAEAIGVLVENESLRRSVGEAGIATVSAWDWEDELAATVRFIKEGGSG
jgi:glycosyltransferase involved in cell wall biosynthesis